ncbi:MAG TPA: DNA polymerase I [Planctomycetota bacterium]|nr:DNA polymerase I [Planctomycetota bacterium]
MPKTLYLIDGHSHIYSAFYAIRGLTTPDGRPINAVYGFTAMLHKILRRRPDYIAVVLDAGEKTFRNDLFEDYKATRKPMPDELVGQLPLIDEVIEAHGLRMVKQPGFEADDIIATLARQAERQGLDVVILTSDKDAQQLLSDRITIYDNRKDRTIDVTALAEEKGITPVQVVEAMALSGDTSDNVPGVPGIGPKTALELIQRYGTLEEVLAHVDEIAGKKRQENLRDFADQARLSKDLVILDDDVELGVTVEDLKPAEPDRQRMLGLFRTWGFKRFTDELLEEAPERRRDYRLVNSPPLFDRFVKELRKRKCFAIDLETTSTFPRDADIVGISFSWKPGEGDYLALQAPEGEEHLDAGTVLAALKPILEDANVDKRGQNLKYDAVVLLNVGIELAGIVFDTMVASYLLSPGKRRHNLDDLAAEYLGHRMIPITDLIGKGKKQKLMSEVPSEKVCEYSCEDADVAWQVADILAPKLTEAELDRLYAELELPLIDVLRDMEWVGVAVDTAVLERLSVEMGGRIDELRAAIYEAADEEFNIDSTRQLGVLLFERLRLPGKKRTKTGYSTDQSVLEVLASMHEVPRLVLEYRLLSKLKGTYVDTLPQLVSPRTGRIHASFNQTVTATGRLSSSDPNLQNIPIRTEEGEEIREAFITGSDDTVLLSADYSQVELRILAHFTGDPALVGAFKHGQDIHAFVASQIYGIKQKDVTPQMRRQAKTVNFGIMYGLSPYGLSNQLGITVGEAAKFIEAYYGKYRSIERFFEETLKTCQANGYVSTMLGRRRYLQGIKNTDGANRSRNQAERMAINTVCQGSAADLIKKAMIHIHRHIRERRLDTKLILQIHDELLFEVPEKELDTVKRMVTEDMSTAIPLDVPLVVNLATGKNWREAK